MSRDCRMEECPNWNGHGCVRGVLDSCADDQGDTMTVPTPPAVPDHRGGPMSDMSEPTEAEVEAAAREMHKANGDFHETLNAARGREVVRDSGRRWEDADDYHLSLYRMRARAALRAAATARPTVDERPAVPNDAGLDDLVTLIRDAVRGGCGSHEGCRDLVRKHQRDAARRWFIDHLAPSASDARRSDDRDAEVERLWRAIASFTQMATDRADERDDALRRLAEVREFASDISARGDMWHKTDHRLGNVYFGIAEDLDNLLDAPTGDDLPGGGR